MDCWNTEYLTSDGNQASASRLFISMDDQQQLAGGHVEIVESSASSAIVSSRPGPESEKSIDLSMDDNVNDLLHDENQK